MNKAVSELKILNNHLFVNSESVGALKKANKIDYPSLIAHFKNSIKNMKN